MRNYFLIIIAVLSILSCSKNDDKIDSKSVHVDKVIFGGIYGACGGDCRDLFMINDEDLYKDAESKSDKFGEWSNTTFVDTLTKDQYNNSADLLEVPSILLEQNLQQKDLVQMWADVDYYIYIEKDGISKELILDHIHRDADPEIKAYFKVFLKDYKELGGYMIDTTYVDSYY